MLRLLVRPGGGDEPAWHRGKWKVSLRGTHTERTGHFTSKSK